MWSRPKTTNPNIKPAANKHTHPHIFLQIHCFLILLTPTATLNFNWTLIASDQTLRALCSSKEEKSQSSHLIVVSSCFLFLRSEPGSCFLVLLPVSHLSILSKHLARTMQLWEEASRRTNRGDGWKRAQTLVSNEIFLFQICKKKKETNY